jgi:hypothetical protein
LEENMTIQQKQRPESDAGRAECDRLNAVIRGQVIHRLGQPKDLLRVAVLPLWAAYYRVNVLVGADFTSARVAQSYFLQADGDGNIVVATPEITRRY